MATVHMTEAEVARDLHAVLEKVRRGSEVVIEQENRAVAVLKPIEGPGRPIDECIAMARARGSQAALDDDFARELDEILRNRHPLDTTVWD